MATKYNITFYDVNQIENVVTIDDPDYVGSVQNVNGYCEIVAGSVDSPIECIKGQGLRIYLDANENLTYQDLFGDNERKFKVVYTRDGSTIFSGFLNPEGVFESFVQDKWTISLDCSDGLSFLSNLSYVDDATGLQFQGKQSELEIIVNCLKRTGLELNINTSIGITYTGQSLLTNVLTQTFLNANRFRKKDSGNTIMNCKEVLCSVLEKYNACIVQQNNAWWIYRPIEIVGSTLSYYRYDSDGVSLGAPLASPKSATIGSQINNFSLFWCGANQSKRYKNRLGAYRINYKYGFVNSFIENIFLASSGGSFDDYTVNDTTYFTIPTSNLGINLTPYDNGTNSPFDISSNPTQLTSDSFSIPANSQVRFNTKFISEEGLFCTRMVFRINLVVGATTYSLDEFGNWVTPTQKIWFENGKENVDTPADSPIGTGIEQEFIVESDVVPGAGNITVEIIAPSYGPGLSATGSIDLIEVGLEPFDPENTNLEGESHTFQRNDSPSSKIKTTKEIFNGDNPSDIYVGTIYKVDETTPTTTWARSGVSETKAILEIMGRDTMIAFQNVSTVFSGDVFGYLDYFSVVSIDGETDKDFIPIEYRYNAKTNVCSLKLFQVFSDTLGSNIDYDVQLDYGEVVDVTVKG